MHVFVYVRRVCWGQGSAPSVAALALSTWFGLVCFETGSLPDLESPSRLCWLAPASAWLWFSSSSLIILCHHAYFKKMNSGIQLWPSCLQGNTLPTERSPQLSWGFSKVFDNIYLGIYAWYSIKYLLYMGGWDQRLLEVNLSNSNNICIFAPKT